MGDHDRRASARDALERRLDLPLGEAVERRRRFVEHQNRRRLQHRARDRDPLLLAARKLEAALADRRLIALRQRADEPVDLGVLGRRVDVRLARAVAPVADVVDDRIVEQHRVLRHHADRGAQRTLGDRADVLPVDQDAPGGRLVEPEQEPRDRRLAGARRPDDGDRVARRRLERNAAQDRPGGIIGELDVLEPDRAGAHLQAAARREHPRSRDSGPGWRTSPRRRRSPA